jgi:hypothetical protein
VKQAIKSYREITVSDEFKEMERMKELASYNEASELAYARNKEAEKWQSVVADKDAMWQSVVADKDAEITRLRAMLEGKS